MRLGRLVSAAFAVTGGFVFACNGVIGIEDLHEEPRPGGGAANGTGGAGNGKGGSGVSDGGSTGSSGRGGGSSEGGSGVSSGGKSTTGTTGGATGEGGAPGEAGHGGETGGAGPGTGGTGTGGVTGSGGKAATGGSPGTGGLTGEAGEGGEAGSGGAGPTDMTVRGRVIDGIGHGVANATVLLGNDSVTTGAKGEFSFANTPAQYDVSLIVTPGVGGGKGSYAWIYQGLTRRDPTLQVYGGIEDHDVDAHVTITNGVFGEPPYTGIAFGSPDGTTAFEADSAEFTSLGILGWFGPTATTGRIHALRWNTDSNDIPTAYQAYYENSLAVSVPDVAQVPITFPGTAITSGAVSGTVTSPTSTFRRNFAFVHFTSNAAISIVDDWNATTSFSYVAPTIGNSMITVAAAEGDVAPYAVAHKTVAAGTTGVTLAIPSPATLVQPAAGTTGVTGSTVFRWSRPTGAGAVVVLHAEAQRFFNGVYIVTAATQTTLPTVALGNMLAGEVYYWTVEMHAPMNSVDQAAAAGGFQDSFGWRQESPVGASRAAGTYTNSESRTFTPM